MKIEIPQEVFELNGDLPGKTSTILVGVHGNEVCGVNAMNQILPTLKIDNGKLFVAYANPRAIEQNVRFTETNLNRMFVDSSFLTDDEKKSYEYERAQYLKTYLDQSDSLLDVHASSNPKSTPFIICERNANDIIDCLPVETVVFGFDDVEPGGTDYYMNKIGRIGVCVECGNMKDEKSTDNAIKSIYSFLISQGHISGQNISIPKKYIQMFHLYKSKTSQFRLTKAFSDFETIPANHTIGFDGEEEIKTDRECIILFAKNSERINQEVFLLGEYIEKAE